MPINGDLINLSNHRLNKADDNMEAARIQLGTMHYSEAINRSYYAIFHSLRALLAYDDFYIASKQEANNQILKAEQFINEIKSYISTKKMG